MEGKVLLKRVLKVERNKTEIAKKLNCTIQNVIARFKVNDVTTGFVEELSKLYDKPLSFFYEGSETPYYDVVANFDDHSATNNSQTTHYENCDSTLVVQLDAALTRISDLEKIIQAKDELISILKNGK